MAKQVCREGGAHDTSDDNVDVVVGINACTNTSTYALTYIYRVTAASARFRHFYCPTLEHRTVSDNKNRELPLYTFALALN